jgi:ribosomal protein S18 acetylase RimI-like enzyme
MSNVLKVEIGDITTNNLQQLKILNVMTLPVRYTDKFYKDLLSNPKVHLKFAYHHGFAVADVCARLEDHPTREGFNRLYIMTIGVLPAYRRRGIASQLLQHIMEIATSNKNVLEVYLHVQTSNDDAKNFYLNKGFTQTGMLKDYYKRISPPDCFVLAKSLADDHTLVITP